jgi:hypothetical protein
LTIVVREVLDVDLVHDARAGRHDLEVIEGALAPAQELVPLLVALVLDLDVALERLGRAEDVGDDGVVDDHLGRCERVDLGGVTAEVGHRLPHGGEIDDAGHAGEVLHDDARRGELDLLARIGVGVPAGQRLDVVLRDVRVVLGAQQALEQHLEAEREAVDIKSVAGHLVESVVLERRVSDVERVLGVEAVDGHGVSSSRCRFHPAERDGVTPSQVCLTDGGGKVSRYQDTLPRIEAWSGPVRRDRGTARSAASKTRRT